MKRLRLDPIDLEAQRMHEGTGWLAWLRWDQLSEASRQEYRRAAARKLNKPLPRVRLNSNNVTKS